jgi:hypothetical protein
VLGKNYLHLKVQVVWARVLVAWPKVAQEKGKNHLAIQRSTIDQMDTLRLFHDDILGLVLRRPNLLHTCFYQCLQ